LARPAPPEAAAGECKRLPAHAPPLMAQLSEGVGEAQEVKRFEQSQELL
jgi:hypothetical protein